MSTGPKKDNRGGARPNTGGARPGAGRPRETLSVRQVREMLKRAKKIEKESGASIDDLLLRIIYGREVHSETVTIKDRIACIKLWKEYTMIKISEGGEADKALAAPGPAVFLPTQRPILASVDGKKIA